MSKYKVQKNHDLYIMKYNSIKFEFKAKVIVGGKVKGSLVIDGEPYGVVDIASKTGLEKVFKVYTHNNLAWEDYFASEYEFYNVLLTMANKIANKDVDKIEDENPEEDVEFRHSVDEIKKFLKNKKILYDIDYIIRHSREEVVVGEESNLMLFFLAMMSRCARHPVNIEFVGQSSSGKTFLVLAASKAFHEKDKIVLSGASAEVLKYDVTYVTDDGIKVVDVDKKILIVLEKEESSDFVKKLKPILSHDEKYFDFKVVEKTAEGMRRTNLYRIKGWPAFITMTIQNPNDVEQLTRELLASTDTSKEKIEQVIESIIDRATSLPSDGVVDDRVSLLQDAMTSFDRVRVYNPFFRLIAGVIPKDDVKMFRDLIKFISLVESMTILHKENRLKAVVNGEEVYISTLEDNILTFSIIDRVFRATFLGIPEQAYEVYKYLSEMAARGKPLRGTSILEYMRARDVKMNRSTLNRHLDALYDKGMITYISTKGDVKVKLNDIQNQLDKILSITPYLLASFIENVYSVFDKKTIELLKVAKIDDDAKYENDKLEKYLTVKYPELKEVVSKVVQLLELQYCKDQKGFVDKILHPDVKKIMRRPQWYKYKAKSILNDYKDFDEIRQHIKERLVGDVVDEEIEQIVMAVEDEIMEKS